MAIPLKLAVRHINSKSLYKPFIPNNIKSMSNLYYRLFRRALYITHSTYTYRVVGKSMNSIVKGRLYRTPYNKSEYKGY